MKVKGNSLSMVRGDSESLIISMESDDGTLIPFQEGDTVYFTVKTSTMTEDKTLQKIITVFQEGIAIAPIDPIDTKLLNYGSYVFDIQVVFRDGTVTTIVPPPTEFNILEEVTYE